MKTLKKIGVALSGSAVLAIAFMYFFGFVSFRSIDEKDTQPVTTIKLPPAGLSVPFKGTTNAQGVYAFNYQNPYDVTPNVQANVVGGNSSTTTTLTRTQSGYIVTAYQRSSVTLLGIEVLLAATTPLANAQVDVLVTAMQ